MSGGDENGGGLGPSDGSWGPQNPDANGVSQYGGNYVDGRFDMGSPSSGYVNNPGSQATFAGTPYDWSQIPDSADMASPDSRRASLGGSMERMHGGGLMGDIGRGLGSLFGVATKLTTGPDARIGYNTSVNPMSVLGLASPIPGTGLLAGAIYDAMGGPKPNWDTFPGQEPTLSAQIDQRTRR